MMGSFYKMFAKDWKNWYRTIVIYVRYGIRFKAWDVYELSFRLGGDVRGEEVMQDGEQKGVGGGGYMRRVSEKGLGEEVIWESGKGLGEEFIWESGKGLGEEVVSNPCGASSWMQFPRYISRAIMRWVWLGMLAALCTEPRIFYNDEGIKLNSCTSHWCPWISWKSPLPQKPQNIMAKMYREV